jgi:hypothetical protein
MGCLRARLAVALVGSATLLACAGEDPASPGPMPAPRSFRMGFSAIPARPELDLALRTVDVWARRADAGLVLVDPPWTELLAGRDPEALVRANPLGLADYFRGKGLRIVASIDPTNGLDRASEAAALVAAGRSLGEPTVRRLYRRYVGAFVTLVRPEAITLASETNLVRAIAPRRVYQAVVAAAHEAAAEARLRDPALRLMTTVQVEVAHGRLAGGAGAGIAVDRADFPFIQALGLSSYPYLGGFTEPDQLPLDYYSSLVADAPLPLLVIEGGWTSVGLGDAIPSSPDKQRRYIERHARILDTARAEAWFQITFTDLDIAGFPFGQGLLPFAFLGLVDASLQPKPALAAWDAAFARPLQR